MDSERFEKAKKLEEDGRTEDALREYTAMALEAVDHDEKAALLANELKCLCRLGQLDKAEGALAQIRELPLRDPYVRLVVDFGEACLTALIQQPEAAASKFKAILDSNRELLAGPEQRDLYEGIQERRAFELVRLEKYDEALPILKEALSFTGEESDQQFVQFYLGVCYAAASDPNLAKESFLHAIRLGLDSQFEASARYRLARLYFNSGAFAQAKFHLESALLVSEGVADLELKRDIYRSLSRTCHFLGEEHEERKYTKLGQSI